MNIWVSYSRRDVEHLNTFVSEIMSYTSGCVNILSDKGLTLGRQFTKEIMGLIKSSDAQVLLVSPAFAESDYCELEMGVMLGLPPNQQKICPVAVTDFNLKNAQNDLKRILKVWTLRQLPDSTPSASGAGNKSPWKKIVLDLLQELNIKPDAQYLSLMNYRNEILDGRFVPFVGPECYGLREAWLPALPYILTRLLELEKRLERKHDKQYAIAVVKSRVPDIGVKQGNPDDPPEFVDLRVAIAEAGAAASRLLGRSLSNCDGLIDARYIGIKINASDVDAQILHKALTTATALAAVFPIERDCLNAQGGRLCLGANGISAKLAILQNSIFRTDISEERLAADESPASLELTLSQLEWLGDLLWHTMRFDVPVLPRTDELAFQLSVCQATKCFVRIPLGTAGVISAKSCPDAADISRRCVPRGHDLCMKLIYHQLDNLRKTNPPRQPTEFYRSIAKLIWQPFAVSQRGLIAAEKSAPSALALVDEGVSHDGRQPRYAMVVSVNIDVELEHCLRKVEYSVIYPVQRNDGKVSAWMLRIHIPRHESEFYLLSQTVEFEKEVRARLKGPLIVKLRGSPLHPLPSNGVTPSWIGKKNEEIGRGATLVNRLILSSLEYARELSDPNLGEPQCVKELLSQQERVLCFIGHPLDDPDGLLGIQRSVWVAATAGTHGELQAGSKISVGCYRHDGLGNAFLSGLSVAPLGIELDKVAEEINKIPNLKDLPDSERRKDEQTI
jgi:TIR domain